MGPNDYFGDLTQSLATARLLLQKANAVGSAIEGLCLYISIIDGFLRLAIIYTRTQKSPDHTYQFHKRMIRQDDYEKTFSEKEIYDIAFRENIISADLHHQLKEMYQIRNKIVHRFSISDVKYIQIAEACSKLESIFCEIFDIVAILEHGPHGIPEPDSKERRNFKEYVRKKIGN